MMNVYNPLKKCNGNKKKSKTNKVTDWLRHEKSRKLLQKPGNERHHFRHRTAPPNRNKQKIIIARMAAEQSQG